jgi:hypothetical protein
MVEPVGLLAVSIAAAILPLATRFLKAAWQTLLMGFSKNARSQIRVKSDDGDITVSGNSADEVLKLFTEALERQNSSKTSGRN